MTAVGVLATGTSLGRREMSASDLAALQGIREEDVRRVIRSTRIHVADESAHELAVRAAQACLAQAGVTPQEVDLIIYCGGSRRDAPFGCGARVQDALGAENAFSIDIGLNCAEMLTALRTARAFLRDDPSLRRALVVSGESWAEHVPRRTVDPMTATNHQNVLSDGGAAALVGASDRSTLLGFGFATNGKYWDLLRLRQVVDGAQIVERAEFKPDLPSDQQLTLDLTRLFRTALERCLAASGTAREEITHLVLPFSGPPVQVAFARALGLPPEKIVFDDTGPTHIGAPDMIHGLEMLHRSDRARPGDRVLLAARSIGLMRFGMLQI